MAQFRQPDHARGDANTIGGYAAVHDRPVAFEGADGFSYSLEILTEHTGEQPRPWAAYLLFVKWSRLGGQVPEGHLESDYVARGATEADARAGAGSLMLQEARQELDALIAERDAGSTRRWWDAMRDDGGDR